MRLKIAQVPMTALSDYARVTPAFTVDRVMDITVDGEGRFVMVERLLTEPYVKDYDAVDGSAPSEWRKRFDLSNWALFSARNGAQRVGWAAAAFHVPELSLEPAPDLAILWDLRVTPEARGKGVGSRLFEGVIAWAQSRGCHTMKIETQNINVPACRFYSRHGCELKGVNDAAYPDFPGEVQMIWRKDLLV